MSYVVHVANHSRVSVCCSICSHGLGSCPLTFAGPPPRRPPRSLLPRRPLRSPLPRSELTCDEKSRWLQLDCKLSIEVSYTATPFTSAQALSQKGLFQGKEELQVSTADIFRADVPDLRNAIRAMPHRSLRASRSGPRLGVSNAVSHKLC